MWWTGTCCSGRKSKRNFCDLKKGCCSKLSTEVVTVYIYVGTKKYPGRKVIKPWPFPYEIQCLCNHSEGLRTGGNKEHKRIGRGTHHNGEFCIGDPGPTLEPRRPQRRNSSYKVWNWRWQSSLDPTTWPSGLVLGIITEHECKLEELFLGSPLVGIVPAMGTRPGLNHSCAVISQSNDFRSRSPTPEPTDELIQFSCLFSAWWLGEDSFKWDVLEFMQMWGLNWWIKGIKTVPVLA